MNDTINRRSKRKKRKLYLCATTRSEEIREGGPSIHHTNDTRQNFTTNLNCDFIRIVTVCLLYTCIKFQSHSWHTNPHDRQFSPQSKAHCWLLIFVLDCKKLHDTEKKT